MGNPVHVWPNGVQVYDWNDRLPGETCLCSVWKLDTHGLSDKRLAEICGVLNGFDNQKLNVVDAKTTRENKLNYMRSLAGEEKLFALHWIRYQ